MVSGCRPSLENLDIENHGCFSFPKLLTEVADGLVAPRKKEEIRVRCVFSKRAHEADND